MRPLSHAIFPPSVIYHSRSQRVPQKLQDAPIPEDREADEISLIDLLGTLLRYKRLIIVFTSLFALGALGYAALSLILPANKSYLPNEYTPHAALLVNNSSSGGLSSMLASTGLGSLAGMAGISGGQSYGELSVYIARSAPILDELIQRFDLTARYKIKKSPKVETRAALLKKYSSSLNVKTGVLTLSFTDRDPVFARDVLNYAVELLDKRFTTIGSNRNLNRKDQLESKLNDVKLEMARLEREVQDFQEKHGIITIESIATEQVTMVAKARAELMMKEMEIKTYQQATTVEDPALRRLKLERDSLAKFLQEAESGFTSYSDTLPSQRQLPKLAFQFATLQRDLMVQNEIYKLLVQQYEATKLALAGEEPVLQVLELAEAPDKKSGPSRGMMVILATMAGFFLSVLLAFLLNAIKEIRNDPEAMAKLRGTK